MLSAPEEPRSPPCSRWKWGLREARLLPRWTPRLPPERQPLQIGGRFPQDLHVSCGTDPLKMRSPRISPCPAPNSFVGAPCLPIAHEGEESPNEPARGSDWNSLPGDPWSTPPQSAPTRSGGLCDARPRLFRRGRALRAPFDRCLPTTCRAPGASQSAHSLPLSREGQPLLVAYPRGRPRCRSTRRTRC